MVDSRSKGMAFERLMQNYLAAEGFELERTKNGAQQPTGDLVGSDLFHIECKNQRALATSGREAIDQAAANKSPDKFGLALVKRPGKADPGESYAVMRLAEFVDVWRMVAMVMDGQNTTMAPGRRAWRGRVVSGEVRDSHRKHTQLGRPEGIRGCRG